MKKYPVGRATGQTTRIVDAAIQTLFSTGKVEVRDHIDSQQCHLLAFDLVVKRLSNEHGRLGVKLNRVQLTIELAK